MAAGAGPAHALYFSVLESGKTFAEKTPIIPPSVADGKFLTLDTLGLVGLWVKYFFILQNVLFENHN